MPIYHYKCGKCDYSAEIILPVELRDQLVGTECPKCGREVMERNITSANFKINGYSEANGYSRK